MVRGKKRPSDAFVNKAGKKERKKKYPSCRKCCLAPQNCSKSTKWKCSLQEPGHHLRMEYERAVRIGPKSDSWNDWLISIFVGSGAVIQRADGKLCNCEGRDWSGRTVGERISEREKMRATEGFIQRDCWGVLFFCWGHSRTFAELVHAGHSAFGLHVCVCLIKQAAYERSPLLSSLSLLFLIYCNVGLRGREPGHDRLTHLTRLEDETYPSTVCTQGALLHAKCHDWYASSVKACVRSGACSVFIWANLSCLSHASPPSRCSAECAGIY